MQIKRLIASFCFICIPCMALAFDTSSGSLRSLLDEIDQMIIGENEYVQAKEAKITAFKERIPQALDEDSRFFIFYTLSKEYETYQCDSAIFYANAAIAAARESKRLSNVYSAKIQLSVCLGKAGIFDEAVSAINEIDVSALSENQQMDYYQAQINSCIYMLEYRGGYGAESIEEKKAIYQTKLLDLDNGKNSYDAIRTKAIIGLESGDYESVKALMIDYMSEVPPKSAQMANIMSLLSEAYSQSGDDLKWKECLAISAISDIASCVRENMSLRLLALEMYNDGDLTRANRYIKKSLDDANFYNARLRNVQIAKVIPIISNAFQQEKARQQTILRRVLITIGLLVVVLLIGFIFIIRQMERVRRINTEMECMNKQLNDLNEKIQKTYDREKMTSLSLTESNRVKELFIRDILDICTDNIYKLKQFRRQVNAKLKSGQTANLIKLASKSLSSSQEKEIRYASFDKAFLKIYPSFIHEFNLLLKEDHRYPEVENPVSLNQELRIFALVKLGISDIEKIQIFLDYSPRTIYNYRSRIKMNALNKDGDFDEKVKALCSVEYLL